MLTIRLKDLTVLMYKNWEVGWKRPTSFFAQVG